jgi:hypothetical protein
MQCLTPRVLHNPVVALELPNLPVGVDELLEGHDVLHA